MLRLWWVYDNPSCAALLASPGSPRAAACGHSGRADSGALTAAGTNARRSTDSCGGCAYDPAVIALPAAAIPVLLWSYLLLARGGFWRTSWQHPAVAPQATLARRVVVVMPARDEAPVIAAAIGSLLRQSFPGSIHIILIDDGSSDGTAQLAAQAAAAAAAPGQLTVLRGAPLPRGWTGKLWAMNQGVAAAGALAPDYLLFTDADIEHDRDSVAGLVSIAEAERRDLVSYMVRLATATYPERCLIPAFVFFFFKLYPPAWVASPRSRTAAAAGGCILIRPQALARAGGLEAIRAQIIDDCALARIVKGSGGRIWLGLTRGARSLRSYGSFAEIGSMISRTAFNQLRHSYLLLVGTLLGLALTYVLPPLLLLTGDPLPASCGLLAWGLMTLAYLPMVRFYGLPALWSLCLPAIALFYAGATLHSAWQYGRGRGGRWKGRIQDLRDGPLEHP
jgi:hopene-associated glycosyltransferase HpnB